MLLELPKDPTYILINHSGGKDSTRMLGLLVEKYKGKVPILVHHQSLSEAWAGTEEYCIETCKHFGVELVIEQAVYYGYECTTCGHHFLSASQKTSCTNYDAGCKGTGKPVGEVRGVVDIMEWRGKWPSNSIRFCTSYLKRDLFNKWARKHRDMLGARPYSCMGERWLESKNRAKLPYFKTRPGVEFITDWHPILHERRREVFRGIRDFGLEPHYCYRLQGMSDYDMYEADEEGGPRCSCVHCFYLSPENIAANLELPQNHSLRDRLVSWEAKSGHYFREGMSIESLLEAHRGRTVLQTVEFEIGAEIIQLVA